MRILIQAPEADAWREALTARLEPAIEGVEVLTAERDGLLPADYLVVWKPDEALFEAQNGRLRAVFNAGAGIDALLANPSLPAEVPIVRLRDAGMGEMMGDYLLYATLHFHRNLDRYRLDQAAQRWAEQPLEEKSAWPVGILGLGTLGRVAGDCLRARGYPVKGWSRTRKTFEGIESFHGEAGLAAMLEGSRVLFNLLPETPETRGLLDEAQLRCLPRGAVVVNAGRGATLVPEALIRLLDEGHLRGAMLDVFPEEPLPADHPLWSHPKVIVTPHVAAPTPVGPAAEQVARDLLALERGETVPFCPR